MVNTCAIVLPLPLTGNDGVSPVLFTTTSARETGANAQRANKTAPTPQREAKTNVPKFFFINAFFSILMFCLLQMLPPK
jgi:hypothetical protein